MKPNPDVKPNTIVRKNKNISCICSRNGTQPRAAANADLPGNEEKNMLSNTLKILCIVVFCGALLAQTGCNCAKGECCETKAPCCETPRPTCERPTCEKPCGEMTALLPPNARPGECYAKVFIPPTFKTVTERVLVRDASDTLEAIPAKYDWVEEKVLVKEASTELETTPAEFATREHTIQVNSGHTDWEINKFANCTNSKDQPAKDVFCLVKHPAECKTIQTQCLVKPAGVRTVCIPAQYETRRFQKLVCAATTRRVCIPAEYETVEKTIKVCDGRMAWQRVSCDNPEAEKVTDNSKQTETIATANAKPTQTIATAKAKPTKTIATAKAHRTPTIATASAQRSHRP